MSFDLPRPHIGQPAPPVALQSARGDSWELAHHRGRSVVLIFHRHIN